VRSEAWIQTNESIAKRPKISTETLDDLPDEVLLKIYAYLSMKNLVRFSGVSKRIRRICHDESLWQKN